MKDKWPGAYKAVKGYAMENDEMNALIVSVDLEGKTVDDVAADWVAKNEDRWKAWAQ
jgi:glycine betaine/proline transport system substrate-binding protein